MKNSKIEWCDHTFNPWWGCTEVPGHPGCAHCYAKAFAKRTGRAKWGKGEARVLMSEDYWKQPLAWNRAAADAGIRARVFCASMADVFDAEVDIAWLARLLGLIDRTPYLDWLLLTKRPENVIDRLDESVEHTHGETWQSMWTQGEPPKNVWLGTSVSNQATADKWIPELLKIPAVCRFISYEPALGPVDFTHANIEPCLEKLDWIIVGGESGPKARPFEMDWARSTIDQCKAAGVACFVKQMGADPRVVVSTHQAVPSSLIKDKKGGVMAEWPADLRVREFPVVAHA